MLVWYKSTQVNLKWFYKYGLLGFLPVLKTGYRLLLTWKLVMVQFYKKQFGLFKTGFLFLLNGSCK